MNELVSGLLLLGAVIVVGLVIFGGVGYIKNKKPKGDPVPGTFPDPDPKNDKR